MELFINSLFPQKIPPTYPKNKFPLFLDLPSEKFVSKLVNIVQTEKKFIFVFRKGGLINDIFIEIYWNQKTCWNLKSISYL